MVVSLLTLAVAGAAWVLALSTFNVAVQMSAPRWVVARALSMYQMFVFAGIALGSWLWGLVTHVEGVRFALLVAGVVLFLSALLGYWRALAETADLNLELLQRWKEPDTEVPVEARTGPVVITIQYVIAEQDILEFLRAMDERRRIRRRDGANDWKLLRDLADPELWIERYSTPTWLDYIRHNSRLTHEDAVIPEKLRALHRGPERPIVRRMIERQTGALPTRSTVGHGRSRRAAHRSDALGLKSEDRLDQVGREIFQRKDREQQRHEGHDRDRHQPRHVPPPERHQAHFLHHAHAVAEVGQRLDVTTAEQFLV